jgi:hypothetical protein
MWYSDAPWLGRMFELSMAAFFGDLLPAIQFQSLENVPAVHSQIYTLIPIGQEPYAFVCIDKTPARTGESFSDVILRLAEAEED